MKIKKTPYIIAALTFCALPPLTRAECTQTCDNQNTAFGQDALSHDPGPFGFDTAIGFEALTNTTGVSNTAVGTFAGENILTGEGNTAVGDSVMGAISDSDGTASFNTAIGGLALDGTNGDNNTAVGYQALSFNDQGANNTASGTNALMNNDSGNNNTADGYQALNKNQTGNDNTATGRGALFSNTASNNTADGSQALNRNITGTDNVAIGRLAMFNNSTGSDNIAIGRGALYGNKTASQSTACGYKALNTSTGTANTAFGFQSLLADTTGSNNVAIGNSALANNISGTNNIAVGNSAGSHLTTGGSNIDIGNAGLATDSNITRIGSGVTVGCYINGITGVTVSGGVGVIIDSTGHLGTMTSSARYKDNIEPMKKASEALLSLEPVTFRYKKELDPQGIPQFGLVAEDVAKIDPDLVARDDQGKPYSVRYEAVNAMLLNEFLKEHRKVELEEAELTEQASEIAELRTALAKQAESLDKVTARLEARN